mmetsp:Transcript_129680/g.415975  ORF Transcript_129680/g.415975 Transcript_129680/m.415975 type:complete len:335 (-) Transcript_129680:25-1029(-)
MQVRLRCTLLSAERTTAATQTHAVTITGSLRAGRLLRVKRFSSAICRSKSSCCLQRSGGQSCGGGVLFAAVGVAQTGRTPRRPRSRPRRGRWTSTSMQTLRMRRSRTSIGWRSSCTSCLSSIGSAALPWRSCGSFTSRLLRLSHLGRRSICGLRCSTRSATWPSSTGTCGTAPACCALASVAGSHVPSCSSGTCMQPPFQLSEHWRRVRRSLRQTTSSASRPTQRCRSAAAPRRAVALPSHRGLRRRPAPRAPVLRARSRSRQSSSAQSAGLPSIAARIAKRRIRSATTRSSVPRWPMPRSGERYDTVEMRQAVVDDVRQTRSFVLATWATVGK